MLIAMATARLERGAATIQALAQGVDHDQARWKPSDTEWSLLEVINHLYDEEREDFRRRLELTLFHPGQKLPPIDPEGWVTERRYNERELGESLAGFLHERRASLTWLQSIGMASLEQPVQHPRNRGLRAGDLLAAWAAHDMLHIRQLNQLHWQYLKAKAEPYRLSYAGRW
jgi:hypothetical protein